MLELLHHFHRFCSFFLSFFFFQSFYLYYSDEVISVVVSSSLWLSSRSLSILLDWAYLPCCKNFSYCIFSLIFNFNLSSIFLLRLFFFCFKHVYDCLLKHLYDGYFKIHQEIPKPVSSQYWGVFRLSNLFKMTFSWSSVWRLYSLYLGYLGCYVKGLRIFLNLVCQRVVGLQKCG